MMHCSVVGYNLYLIALFITGNITSHIYIKSCKKSAFIPDISDREFPSVILNPFLLLPFLLLSCLICLQYHFHQNNQHNILYLLHSSWFISPHSFLRNLSSIRNSNPCNFHMYYLYYLSKQVLHTFHNNRNIQEDYFLSIFH